MSPPLRLVSVIVSSLYGALGPAHLSVCVYNKHAISLCIDMVVPGHISGSLVFTFDTCAAVCGLSQVFHIPILPTAFNIVQLCVH